MYKCNIAFIIGFIPFFIYGVFSPFTRSYMILLYTFYIFLNFFYFFIATHIAKIFIVLYFIVACIVGAVLFYSVLNYVYLILILLLGASLIAFILYKTVEQKNVRKTLVAAQAFFCFLMCFAILNLNILHIESTELESILRMRVLRPLFILHMSSFVLFSGYGFFNLGKLFNDHKLLKYGVRSTFGLLYLALGITILLIYYKLPILAIICFSLGLITTIFLYSYSNKEFKKAKRKSEGKKK